MKKDEFEPARILSKPGQRQDDAGANASDNSPTDPIDTAGETDSQTPAEAVSFEGILDPLMGKGKAIWAAPFDMLQNGVFNGLYNQPLEQVAQNVKGFIRTGLSHILLVIGYYFSAVFFDNDEKRMFSRNRYKGTSINDLVNRRDVPFTRQQVTDCLKAACMDMHFRKDGHQFENLSFDHLRLLARVRDPQKRLSLAQEADQKQLTPSELENRIDELLGRKPSEDKRIAKAVARQLKDIVRMSTEDEIEEILTDKDRLKAALSTTETAQLLESCEKFRENLHDSMLLIANLEITLNEIQADKAKQLKPAS